MAFPSAVDPQAQVTITGVSRSAASDASGLYTIALQPGTYGVTVHASGFSDYKVAPQVAQSVTEK